VLAAVDDVTRQRCMRIIEAASAGASPMKDIASAAALTSDLLNIRSLLAIQAVLAVLDIAISDPSLKAVGLNLPALKASGFDLPAFRAAGCSWADIKSAGFTAREAKASGFNLASVWQIRSAGFTAVQLKDAGCDCRLLKDAGFSALQSRDAGFHLSDLDLAGYDFKELQPMFGYEELAQVHPFFQR